MSFTFKSPVNPKHTWNLCFRDRDEMNRIFYENRPVDQETRLHGMTEYISQTIYLSSFENNKLFTTLANKHNANACNKLK